MRKVHIVFEEYHFKYFANMLSINISNYFMYVVFGIGGSAQIILARNIFKEVETSSINNTDLQLIFKVFTKQMAK